MLQAVEQQLKQAGLLLDKKLVFGSLQRIAATNHAGKRKAKSGWYSLFEYTRRNGEVLISGAYGNHSLGISEKIEQEIKEWSKEERDEYRQKMLDQQQAAEKAKQEATDICIDKAQKIWPTLQDSGVNEYLNRKQVKGFGVRFCAGKLVVPVYNNGQLVSLQWIQPDGEKMFMTGTPKKGAYFYIGKRRDKTDVIAIVEGYATGASVYMATGWPVFVAFDAGNLEAVALQVRQKYETARIVICADKDSSGVGQAKANQAAKAVDAEVALPKFASSDTESTDFNDVHVKLGIDALTSQLFKAPVTVINLPAPLSKARTEKQENNQGDSRFGRYDLADLLNNFSLIYNTDTCWDGINDTQMRLSNLRHLVGRNRYKEWDEDDSRKVVKALVFEPSGVIPPNHINLFKGLEIKPSEGGMYGCQKILNHISMLCKHREAEFMWLLKWIAYPLQHLGAKMATSVIMYGKEGPGKSILWEKIVSAIYGKYAITIGQPQLESQFTGWQSQKLLALCEEVVSRAEKSHYKGALKHLVTGGNVQINEKNMPLRCETNHVNFVFLSNSTVPLELDLGDRRYGVLYCGEVPLAQYFIDLFAEIENGGIEAFYGYLLALDLGDFSPHTKPIDNLEKQNLVEASLPAPVLFYQEWVDGLLEIPFCSCQKSELFEEFKKWCDRKNEFKKRDRDFTAEMRRYMAEDRKDLTMTGYAADRKTTRIWVTPEDLKYQNSKDYIAVLEKSCKAFTQATKTETSGGHGHE